MKLYTRTGDDGSTGLFGSERVGKDHPRVEAGGCVDELNACIGLALAACDESGAVGTRCREILTELQSRLFDLGADLATPQGATTEKKIQRVGETEVRAAEAWIDEIDAGNAPITGFVLPGGTELACRLHLARTVCRRLERRMVVLGRMTAVNLQATILVNRISDLLFAMARRVNLDAGAADVLWRPAGRAPGDAAP